MERIISIVIVVIAVLVLIVLAIFINFLGVFIRALVSGCPVTLFQLVAMKLKRIPPGLIVDTYIVANHAELPVTLAQLEAHYLVGGHVRKLVNAMIRTKNLGSPVAFELAAAKDLAGYDLDTLSPDEFGPKINPPPLP